MKTRVSEISSPDGSLTFVVERDELGDSFIGLAGYPNQIHMNAILIASHGSPEDAVNHNVAELTNDRLVLAILKERNLVMDAWLEESPERQLYPNEIDGMIMELRYWSGAPYIPWLSRQHPPTKT